MMNNLFIMFDPSSNYFSLNWLAVFLPVIFLPKMYYFSAISARNSMSSYILLKIVESDLMNSLKVSLQKNLIIFLSLFFFISYSNLLSILPFVFAPTSHLVLNLSISLLYWFSLFFMSWVKMYTSSLIHLVPMNTPLFLCPFMVLIETISNLIRPFTLAIRLTANIIAGHILISLLSGLLDSNFLVHHFASSALNLLLILELSVAVIQGYVFIILLSLYMSEVIS